MSVGVVTFPEDGHTADELLIARPQLADLPPQCRGFETVANGFHEPLAAEGLVDEIVDAEADRFDLRGEALARLEDRAVKRAGRVGVAFGGQALDDVGNRGAGPRGRGRAPRWR